MEETRWEVLQDFEAHKKTVRRRAESPAPHSIRAKRD
jgi:hypothetical protein